MMLGRLPDAKLAVITFHKGTQRSYIFVLHKEHFRKYSEAIKIFLHKWYSVFTEEYGNTGSLAGGKTGEKFHVTGSNGVELTIEEYEDGWVTMHFSDRENCSMRITIDHLINLLR